MSTLRRLLLISVAVFILSGAGGCAYLENRGADALDTFDIGLTFTKKPMFCVYYRLPIPLAGIAEGKVDGWFAGMGGGNIGWMRHYERNYGMFLKPQMPEDPDAYWKRIPIPLIVSGVEEVAYGDFDKYNNEQTRMHRMGLVGMFQGPFPEPDYFFSCPHYLHIGWIGAVGTPRFNEWLDFALGFLTIDISGDDGRPRGYWWWNEPDWDELTIDKPLSNTYIGRARWMRTTTSDNE